MDLSDNISVDYSRVEELFSSKTVQPKETEKVKKPTEVRRHIVLRVFTLHTWVTVEDSLSLRQAQTHSANGVGRADM